MNDINGNVTLMQFMDTLGNDNYAISILGYWIFDSNCEKSLCLKRESLDLMSSPSVFKEQVVIFDSVF